jgi:hypothetical protein
VKAVILEICDIGELTPIRPAEDCALIEVGLKTISGSPEETEAHLALWRAIREGRLAGVTHDVERIFGHSLIALDQWAAENADSFHG